MIYSADIDTPANTSKNSPLKTILRVTKGLVYKVEIDFPPGSNGLLYCAIKDGGYRVWPTGSDSSFRGDNVRLDFEDIYLKLNPPFLFDIFTYNLDDTYNHVLVVRLGLVSKEIFMARFLPTYTYDHFIKLLAEIAKSQQTEQTAKQAETLKKPFGWL